MEMPIATAVRQSIPGLPNVTCLCPFENGMVLGSCFESKHLLLIALNEDDVQVVNVFDTAPDMDLGYIEKIRYMPQRKTVYVLVGGAIRVYHYNAPKNTFGEGLRFFFDDSIMDFDVVGTETATLLAIVCSSQASTYYVTFSEYFLINSFPRKDASKCRWVSCDCVCVYGDHMYICHGCDGTVLCQISSGLAMANCVCPLLESYEFHDSTSTFSRKNQFAVVVGGATARYFANQLRLFQEEAGVIKPVFSVPLFASSAPRCVWSVGPWLAVGGPFGVEFYEQSIGLFAQSVVDNCNVLDSCWSNATIDVRKLPNDASFSRPHVGLVVTNKGLFSTTMRSILDVVDEMVSNALFNADMIECLMRFGHSVHARQLMRPSEVAKPELNGTKEKPHPNEDDHTDENVEGVGNYALGEYGMLLAEFRLPDTIYDDGSNSSRSTSRLSFSSAPNYRSVIMNHGATVIDRVNGSATEVSDVGPQCCALCHAVKPPSRKGRSGSLVGKKSELEDIRRCSICKRVVCASCSVLRNLRGLGYTFSARKSAWTPQSRLGLESLMDENDVGSVCADCDGACDLNLFRLFVARRYIQILAYIREHPGQCFKFSVQDVVPVLLSQCFFERKYELVAWMLEQYVSQDDPLWNQWIAQFAMRKCLDVLLDAHNPGNGGVSTNTGLLLQLVKTHALLLNKLIHTWPQRCFSADVVLVGIESRLRYKISEAQQVQQETQRSELSVAEEVDAVSYLYVDCDVARLLRVYLHLCLAGEEYLRAARTYMEYYVMMLPLPDVKVGPRSRSQKRVIDVDLVVSTPPTSASIELSQDIINFWDFIETNGIIEDLVKSRNSSGDKLLLTPLLMHYREELGQYLVSVVDSATLGDIVDEVVHQLEASQPEQLVEVLDTLTTISPRVTSKHHMLMAVLYLKYMPDRLLSFIQNPLVSDLNWKQLASQVEERRMFPELVYIIGRTGNDQEAIRIALRCIKDVPLAMRYVRDHPGDHRLWDSLVRHVSQSPVLLGDFFDCVDDTVNVSELLGAIPEENRLEIANFGPRIFRILTDRQRLTRISESALGSAVQDTFSLEKNLRQRGSRGIRFDPQNACCGICGLRTVEEFIVGGCGHSFHHRCVEAGTSSRTKKMADRYRGASPVQPVLNSNKEVARRMRFISGLPQASDSGINGDELDSNLPSGSTQQNFMNGTTPRKERKRRIVEARAAAESSCADYEAMRRRGERNVIKLLPEELRNAVFRFLTIADRERCRRVSKGFRRSIGSFYLFSERFDDNLNSAYALRLQENGNFLVRPTVKATPVPIFYGNPYSSAQTAWKEGVTCTACIHDSIIQEKDRTL